MTISFPKDREPDIRGEVLTDLELSYAFGNHFTLAVGAQNFTDERPDRLKLAEFQGSTSRPPKIHATLRLRLQRSLPTDPHRPRSGPAPIA